MPIIVKNKDILYLMILFLNVLEKWIPRNKVEGDKKTPGNFK